MYVLYTVNTFLEAFYGISKYFTSKIESVADWIRNSYGSIPEYVLNDEVAMDSPRTSDGHKMNIAFRSQVAYLNPPTSDVSQWRWEKWDNYWSGYPDALKESGSDFHYYVYKDRLGQLTGSTGANHAGEAIQKGRQY